ncbi:hypothetical protein Tco_0940327, partial [Tanacetum coccineum]
VYVDDIIFGSTKKSWCDEFEALMKSRFQMSSMGELTFLLGLQSASTLIETQKPLNKDEEAANVDLHLYRSVIGSLMYLTASRPDIMYLKGKPKLGLWYPRVSSFDLDAYSDSDYDGANLDRKSTTGGCQFLSRRLISWQCKKQTIVATSTTKAEYVAAANCLQGDQPPVTESSYRPDTTQDPRVNLEGTGGSQGDHVQIPHDSPLSGGHTSDRAEGGLNLDELLVLCTNLSNRVLALETSKDAQAAEILKLKTRIKKLEKKCKPSISHHRAWLRSVSRLSRKKKLGKKESVSKQGRKNAKPGPTLDAFDDLDAELDHGMDYMETKEAVKKGRQSNETEELNLDADTKVITEDKGNGEKGVNTVSTARPEVNTASAPFSTAGVTNSTADPKVSVVEPRTPPTTSIFNDEDITMAQTLIKMKEEKAKEKGVAFKDVEDSSRPVRSITTLKPLPSIDPKDKGKGILVEEEPVKIKRKDQGIDQIERDEELAHKLHEEELAEIARIQEEKAAQEEASRTAIMEMIDEVQAATHRKFRAAQRAAEIRSRPPTKAQLRNLMMTYLKNMGGYKHSQLKAKTFEEIQGMYKRQKKKIDDFKPMDSNDAVKNSKKAASEDTSKKKEVLKESDSTKVEVKLEEAE